MSRNATERSVTCTTSASTSPATIPQNRQPSTTTLPPSHIVPQGCQPTRAVARQTDVTTPALDAPEVTLDADSDADAAVEQLYAAHWRRLVRLAVLLLRDQGAAEEVVQDAFVAMHGRWRSLRDPDKALAYLRQAGGNRPRAAPRPPGVVERYVARQRPGVAPARPPDA